MPALHYVSHVGLVGWFGLQETNAATKIQSIVRRKQVMDTLEAKGKSTAAIRNRRRLRHGIRRCTLHLQLRSLGGKLFGQWVLGGNAHSEEKDQHQRAKPCEAHEPVPIIGIGLLSALPQYHICVDVLQ